MSILSYQNLIQVVLNWLHTLHGTRLFLRCRTESKQPSVRPRDASCSDDDDSDSGDDTRPASDADMVNRRPSRPSLAGGRRTSTSSSLSAANLPRQQQGSGCLAPEVAEFEAFVLQRGGDCGGWDREDHEEFVRIVKACAGDYVKAVDVCMDRVIGFNRSEVMEHARWHMDYMDLLVG